MKHRLLWIAVFIAGIVISMMLAFTFAAIAFYSYLAPLYGSIEAACLIAFTGFVIAVLLGGAAMLLAHRTKQHIKNALRVTAVSALGPAAVRTAAQRLGGLGALAAVTIGYLIARKRSI